MPEPISPTRYESSEVFEPLKTYESLKTSATVALLSGSLMYELVR